MLKQIGTCATCKHYQPCRWFKSEGPDDRGPGGHCRNGEAALSGRVRLPFPEFGCIHWFGGDTLESFAAAFKRLKEMLDEAFGALPDISADELVSKIDAELWGLLNRAERTAAVEKELGKSRLEHDERVSNLQKLLEEVEAAGEQYKHERTDALCRLGAERDRRELAEHDAEQWKKTAGHLNSELNELRAPPKRPKEE